MDKAVEQSDSRSKQTLSKSKPVVKLVQDIFERVKTFFTVTEEEKDAAGICTYKNGRI